MTDLASVFERLGLTQYLENFIDEGFDSWDTVLYITESDLDALNVKLGHRRKLQKEIAYARGAPIEQIISPLVRTTSADDGQPDSDAKSSTSQTESRSTGGTGSKRKYRRHPKPDENAPERSPSAYVIFSNRVREELRPQNLSFTEIAKTVGERWQLLQPEGKEPYESQAASLKEAYSTAMAKYKRTQQYQDYQHYLAEFKARYGGQSSNTDGKRAKLESNVSTGSSSSAATNSNAGYGASDFARKDSAGGRYSPVGVSSAHSNTSLSAHRHRLSSSSQSGTSPLRSSEARHLSPLPRILPLDNRDAVPSQGRLAPLLTDFKAPPISHPRRSDKRPASLIHQDTSKSSVSSTFSSTSVASSQMTPVTPVDEARSRPLQTLMVQGSAFDPGQPSYPPLAPKPSGSPYSGVTPTPAADHRSQTSGSDEVAISDDRSRSRSTPHDYAMEESPFPPPSSDRRSLSMRLSPGQQSVRQEGRQLQDLSSAEGTSRPVRMDALSVLAMAGRMVDREPPRPDERQ